MSQEARNKAAFNRFHDAVNSGDVDLISKTIDEAVDPDLLLRAFPDLQVAIEDVIAEGDKVVYRNTVTGTHQGEYRGVAPTGKSISYNEIFIFRFTEGRTAEIWGVVDVLAQLRQLGVVPA